MDTLRRGTRIWEVECAGHVPAVADGSRRRAPRLTVSRRESPGLHRELGMVIVLWLLSAGRVNRIGDLGRGRAEPVEGVGDLPAVVCLHRHPELPEAPIEHRPQLGRTGAIIALGFTLNEIAVVSKIFGFFSIVLGALLGGVVTVRFGLLRSLVLSGILQAAGNLFFVLQAVGGHRIGYLALCVTAENITGGMAGTALVAYISSLCSPAFTATQYALLASVSVLGRTVIGSTGGALSEAIGWVPFFLLTTVASVPALWLLVWIERRAATQSHRPRAMSSLAGERNL